ncbi:hypothetical protein [Amycolatopsis cihanbeyliensis]|uniref:Uncharacterized protein n=1 Tax=Amycolatopsis cihanbeyliensis TaxID=1128664 RepID=A0A542DI52_AMYCI|nr:hypothetical protein [Amycolatopsis cihanbeyliensis]TQJ02777.1 hypothetical protein FB471_2522 [Amycolatopsis cihanbeyliensis]
MNVALLVAPPVVSPQREVPDILPDIAFGVVGICTFVLYLAAIRRGYLDKRSTLPVFAACANVAWEVTYAFIYPIDPMMRTILYFWLPLNLVLLFQAVRYGRKDFGRMSARLFGWMVAGFSAFAFTFIVAATREFGDDEGVYTTVFVVVLMESLFLVTLWVRRSTEGQTMYIAVVKTLIDASGGVALIAWYPDRWLLHQMIAAELILDAVYIVALYRQFRAEGASPWRKF